MNDPAAAEFKSDVRHLSLKELRDATPLLRLDVVRPGDVLLTTGRKLHSRAISAATKGEFSHAAIWVAIPGARFPLLAEADGFGIGYTPLPFVSLCLPSDRGRWCLAATLPDQPTRYKLLRHPDAHRLTHHQLVAATERLVKQRFYKSYPDLANLAKAADLSQQAEAIARVILRAVDHVANRRRSPLRQSGSFCSELVARYFDELGLTLFAQPLESSSVSPNRLDSHRSLLQEVEGAFVSKDDIREGALAMEHMRYLGPRAETVPMFVHHKEVAQAGKRINSAVKEMVNRTRELAASGAVEFHRKLFERIQESYACAHEGGDAPAMAKLRRLAIVADALARVDERVASERAQPQVLDRELSEDERVVALDQLSQAVSRLRGEYAHAHLRILCLIKLRILRKQDKPSTSPMERTQIQQDRRLCIRVWIEEKDRRSVRAMQEHAADISPAALAYMSAVVCASIGPSAADFAFTQGQSTSTDDPGWTSLREDVP